MESQKKISVCNLGQVPAVFTIQTSEPFFVNPSKGVLSPNKNMQLTIYFRPIKIGPANNYLIVSYESGEKLSIKISGRAENLNIQLEKGALRFKKTFMGLSRQKTIKVHNNSEHIVKFQWKQYSCTEAEEEKCKKITKSLYFMKEHEKIRDNKLEMHGIIDGKGHSKICDRIFEDELEELEEQDKFMYQHRNFQIIPLVCWNIKLTVYLIIIISYTFRQVKYGQK